MLRIVIPAYNEEARIARTIMAYSAYFGDRARICVVANGCTDQTVEIVSQMIASNENLELIEVPFAIGKGGAVRVGLMSGDEEFVGFTDADCATPPESFADLSDACAIPGTDAAIGSRWMRASNVISKQPILRRGASRAFNLFARLVFGLNFADTQCGCKIFRRVALEEVLPQLELSNFAFDLDLLYAFKRAKLLVREIPVTWADHPDSKLRFAKIWFTLLFGLIRLRLRTGPFRSIPFLRLLARSNVIEVKQRFRVLVLALRSNSVPDEAKIRSWSILVSEAGHEVEFRRAKSQLEKYKILFWYFRSANVAFDLIVDVDAGLPDWFRLISTKANVGPEVFSLSDINKIFEELPSYFGFSQFIFDPGRQKWILMGGTPRRKVQISTLLDKASAR